VTDAINPAGVPGLTGTGTTPSAAGAAGTRGAPPAGGFEAALERAGSSVQFSRHATKRMEQRGLDLDASRLERLEQAVGRAADKGSRDSLILLDELALVVSVQQRTVVTAMDETASKEHVFTNIDSVVIAD
jgi:flagellar operon protein